MLMALDIDIAEFNSVLNVALLANSLDFSVDLLLSVHRPNLTVNDLLSDICIGISLSCDDLRGCRLNFF